MIALFRAAMCQSFERTIMTFKRIIEKHHAVAFVLLLFLFFPLLWLSQYNYPSGDDYRVLLHARRLGALGGAAWWYTNWSGRYASFLLQNWLASRDDWLTTYKLLPVALIFSGFVCVYCFVRALFGRDFNRRVLFTLSTVIYVLLVSLTPDVATGLYWFSTNAQYVGASFISLLIFALDIELSRAESVRVKATLSLLVVVLVALVAGSNEISAIFLICAFVSINCFHFVKFKKLDKPNLLFLVLSVLFAALSFFAHGNFVRVRTLGAEFHPAKILFAAPALTFYFLFKLAATTPLLPASALYLLFLQTNRDRLRAPLSLLSGIGWQWILFALLCSVTAADAALFAAVGVSANSVPYRVENVYVYTIVSGWLFFLTALFADSSRKGVNFQLPKWATALLAVFVLFFLLTGFKLKLGGDAVPSANSVQRAFSVPATKSVYTQAYLDILSGRAQRYARLNEERARRLVEAKTDPLDFPLYSYVPETIFIQDVNQPFAAPDVMTEALTGEVKRLRYVATGVAPAPKEGF
jgi:hypothetical protein